MDQLHLHTAQLHPVAGPYSIQLGLSKQVMLLQLAAHQANGKRGAVNRYVKGFQKVRDRADMILMAVGNHQALNSFLVPLHIGEIRNHQIHAQHISIGEGHAAVQQEHILAALKQGNVFPNFVQASEKRHLNRRLSGLFLSPLGGTGSCSARFFRFSRGLGRAFLFRRRLLFFPARCLWVFFFRCRLCRRPCRASGGFSAR